MSFERSARALLVAASFAALASCSVRQEEAAARHEITASTVAALDGDTWPESDTIPRFHHAGSELDGGGALVCGGINASLAPLPNCELLEVQDGALKSTPFRLPEAQGRYSPSLTPLPTGGVLLAGGWSGGIDGDLQSAIASRPISEWLQADDNPSVNWLSPEKMNVPREGQTATLLGTSVVVIGGYSRGTSASVGALEVRTGAGAPWAVIGAPEPRRGHTATQLKPDDSGGARMLVLGGSNDSPSGVYLKSGFIFSLADQHIEVIPEMPGKGRYGHTATLLGDANGSVLVVGGEGEDSSTALDDAWRYDPVAKEWTPAGAADTAGAIAPQPRRFHGAVRLGDYVIVAGGMGSGSNTGPTEGPGLTSVQSYDWKRGTWSNLRSLTQGRAYLQLLKLNETQIVASAGRTSSTQFPTTSELISLSPLGPPSSDAPCASGHQVDGVCCESDCAGTCQACNVQGLCQPVSGMPQGERPQCDGNMLCVNGTCPTQCTSTNDCVAGTFCSANNECVGLRGLGGACDSQAQCANGTPCVDHVCCESECRGPCEACDSQGVCRARDPGAAPVRPDPSCSAVQNGDAQCAARCDGIHRDRCVFPGSESICSAVSCDPDSDSLQPPSACDGHGACQAIASVEQCAPYKCDATANQCRESCGGDQDCSYGVKCDENHRCLRCHTGDAACHGFACDTEADECKHTCQRSDTDCVGGFYCHPLEHRCVAAVRFPASELPACAIGRGRVSHRGLGVAAAAWLLFSVWRRRVNPNRTRLRTRSH